MVTFGEMHRPDSDGNPPFFRMQSCGNLNDDLPAQTQPQEVRNHETGSPLASTDEYKQNVIAGIYELITRKEIGLANRYQNEFDAIDPDAPGYLDKLRKVSTIVWYSVLNEVRN